MHMADNNKGARIALWTEFAPKSESIRHAGTIEPPGLNANEAEARKQPAARAVDEGLQHLEHHAPRGRWQGLQHGQEAFAFRALWSASVNSSMMVVCNSATTASSVTSEGQVAPIS
jgi:hypothetical protein